MNSALQFMIWDRIAPGGKRSQQIVRDVTYCSMLHKKNPGWVRWVLVRELEELFNFNLDELEKKWKIES